MRARLAKIACQLINFYYNAFNRQKPSVLIYTDSRGYDVLSNFGKVPLYSYIGMLIKRYRVKYYICPEKHTTIIDFLRTIEKQDLLQYDYVILHCGVVDFSPRPLSNLAFVLKSKSQERLFNIANNTYKDYYLNPSNVIYNGEATQNLYPPEFLEQYILPKLQQIDNLIWISSNNFVSGWDGNYKKGRPANIQDYVHSFDSVMSRNLKNVIDLRKWNSDKVKKFTIDNIHFNREGFKEIYNLIESKINS